MAVQAGTPHATVTCKPVDSTGRCELEWRALPGAGGFAAIQKLRESDGRWGKVRRLRIGEHSRRDVAPGSLYRVVACEDRRLRRNCEATTAFWAPVLVSASELPNQVVDGAVPCFE